MYVQLTSDKSFLTLLDADDKPTINIPNGRVILVVDIATWYVFHEGTWYAQ